ncbi:DNA polymerase III subunit gamma and tau [Curtobacterium sp. MCJR17_055]|uniref:DNA polymerase III subunit gamma and tau n=1 Tax=unclassified Curtobacterium TaxID=257496 RepID=UPI000D853885|nr:MULTISPECIES: DNA polymerase III subunit gamma and tau [unclassified Curtobacterium]PYY36059.1 DNA polymerase III subunit gamma and tau [Curtobacterium sp. MCBD17_029]PYY54839.1 DNA polymerase III subunit gamma and tau [Curtobacterium sp. MCJR17_055]PYY61075.1 DNA polymerase III subunit gamma and tau [Curtobacterium sp. MCPF17_015]
MVTALYRRYRPENFAELIGQSQVTDPLRTALRTNRVNHAYLFSGPRGCGKTTSARILARCLNCAEGPTDTPCGVCPSCVELARGGGGSLDVIEIDAASHNGVDDARDLRDRAVFAPARDRYKIFILDEAHMVTPQGFNALLKLVEEPPEHVKFIFATTEPEKVIGTIRSRTHHYPFRLVPPATMLEYIEQLCAQESVSVAPGVLPLVVRAGGGSVRDTLSLLDQLMAGSEDGAIAYERAVALLGYTDAALLDDVVDALAVADPASAFSAIDRVVQTGQDPRRFVEDLLERLRDLIVVAATNESAGAVLRGVSPEELDTMSRQAGVFGATALSRGADIANRALTEMTGATSPRLHLELMVARMLVPESDDTQRGALARVERLERRVGVGDAGGHQAGPAELPTAAPAAVAPAAVPARPATAAPTTPTPATTAAQVPAAPATSAPVSAAPGSTTSTTAPVAGSAPAAGTSEQAGSPPAPTVDAARSAAASWAAAVPESTPAPAASPSPQTSDGQASPSSTGVGTVIGDEPAVRSVTPVGLQQMRDTWPQIVEHVQRAKRSAWAVVATAQVTALKDDVLTLTFPSQQDVASFKEMSDPNTSVSEHLRAAINDVLGFRVKFVARGPGGGAAGAGATRPPSPPTQAGPTQAAPAQAARTQAAPQAGAGRAEARQAAPAQSARTQDAPAQAAPDRQGGPSGAAVSRAQQETPSAGASAPSAGSRPAARQGTTADRPSGSGSTPAVDRSEGRPTERTAPQRDTTARQDAEPRDAAQQDAGPVTEWAVATIPASDPTAGAVPEDIEPSWAAPFGTVPADAAVAPAERTAPQPAPAAALAASGPVGAPARTGSDDQAIRADAVTQGGPPGRDAPRTAAGVPSDAVPVDDYPLDDEPFDDGAPHPDPGPGGGRPAQTAPQRQMAPQQQTAPRQQSAPPRTAQPSGGQQQPTAQQGQQAAGNQSGVRRTAVPGRYGEAVVREILGAQFIEETSLTEGGV